MKLPPHVSWLFRSVKRRGLVRTGKVAGSVLLDFTFDVFYGTETMGWVATEELGADSQHHLNAVSYRATKAGPLRKLLKKLHLPTDCAFVDLGSGKGRVLLLAAQLGFKKVVGLEFSPKLCAIARQNVRVFTRQMRITSHIDVIEADIALVNIKPDWCIFYAYNPFDEVVMQRWVAKLRESVVRSPRRVWVVYNTPVHGSVIESAGLFSMPLEYEIGGVEFKVYEP